MIPNLSGQMEMRQTGAHWDGLWSDGCLPPTHISFPWTFSARSTDSEG